jgi:hypothetical protein
MRMYHTALTLTLVMVLVTVGGATAQEGQGKRGAAGAQQVPPWDPSTVQTVKGTVASEQARGPRSDIFVVVLKTENGNEFVVLGPQQILDPALASLIPDTPVEVTGSKVKGKRRDFILASRVKVGDREYMLRNDQGQLLGKDGQPVKRGAAQ